MLHLKQAFWALCLSAASVSAETYPAHPDVYVNDYAGLLSVSEEAQVRTWLTELYDRKGIEMTVLTLTTMRDFGWSGEIEPYATRLFNTWGIGNAERNDGVLLLVAKADRQMRIEIGAGYDSSWDAKMQEVIDDEILPEFRADRYNIGIIDGVKASIHALTGSYPGEYDATFFQRLTGGIGRTAEKLGLWLFALMAPLMAIPVGLYRVWQRRRPRFCPVDRSPLVRMDEAWDDNALQPGERVEERVGSVDYDVWKCDQCGHLTVEGYKSFFTRYSACRQCGCRTVYGNERIVRSATTSSEGLAEVDYHCENCQARYTTTRTIPRRSESSSSRSSFGGGRSSGGGASGRW